MIHKAKKSLGQNFLKSEIALRKIIEAGEIKPDDIILEIGPGKGVLTEKILECAGLVIAVEKDRELFEFLKIKFEKEIMENPPSHKATGGQGKLILINDDILKFDLNQTILSFLNGLAGIGTRRTEDLRKTSKLFGFKIIANIPYNITGAILKKFLTEKNQPESMVLMVQHEVAKRITGRGSNPSTPLRVKESILSISVKAYGEPKIVMKVPARYFSPVPKVDSAIISIKNISRKIFKENKINEERFWEVVKAGFAHKRKKLSSNLKNTLPCQKTSLIELGNKRAEDLSLTDWTGIILNNKLDK
ncbi:MAG: 16S rRNA (adenine(1518)-N(6)/adenine(1519)-N(6))-dimethyltransferase RsmA [Patescibacteria group bacterium]